MDTTEMITYKEFVDDIKAKSNDVETIHWCGHDILVRKYLSMTEMLSFVQNVIEVCYQPSEDNGVAIFMPELREYAIDFYTIAFYTNIDLTDGESIEGEANVDDIGTYDFIVRSGIINEVVPCIDQTQFDSIMRSIGAKIKYINETSAVSVLSDVGEVNNAINELAPQLQELLDPENSGKLQEALNVITKFAEDKTIQQLAIAQMKNG